MVACRVRDADFTPLDSDHRRYAVTVQADGAEAFRSAPRGVEADELLFADLQINPDINRAGRLGSGRSGFYRGAYLKGIGLTPLAANWHRPHSVYHASGVLFPSGGVREFLVSEYVRARGRPEIVIPCTGILLAPLESQVADVSRASFAPRIQRAPDLVQRLPPVDRVLQAISVKPGGFARFSNLTWWLYQLPFFASIDRLSLADFFTVLGAACGGDLDDEPSDTTPDALARSLAAAIETGFENLMTAWTLGVQWGSTHNNFSLDGRFLDLEVPTVLPHATLGGSTNRYDADTWPEQREFRGNQLDVGLVEVFHFLAQARRFVQALTHHLRFLNDENRWLAIERDYTTAFLVALESGCKAPHIISSPHGARRRVMDFVTHHLQLTSTEERDAGRMVLEMSRPFDSELHARDPESFVLQRSATGRLACSEPLMEPIVYVPGFIHERRGMTNELAIQYNDEVWACDAHPDTDSVLTTLRAVRDRWRRVGE
jgi:hypothetical protein